MKLSVWDYTPEMVSYCVFIYALVRFCCTPDIYYAVFTLMFLIYAAEYRIVNCIKENVK